MEKKLKIGDEETAIIQIQASQSDPLKALAGLVENSIDERAKKIEILRCKHKGNVELIITDNGDGVQAGSDGNSDMDRIPNSICDSIKRKFDKEKYGHVIGEFAIGILGFATMGKNFEMLSRTETSIKTNFLRMEAGSVDYKSGNSDIKLEKGTRIKIWPVHDNIVQKFTAEKIKKYLGEELSERIRANQVKIFVEDKIRRKNLEVKPLDYKGDKISEINKVKTPQGNIMLKLYVAQQGETGKVSVYRRGTKVLDNIMEIEELDHEPWNNSLLEGMVHSRFINVPPTTRKGILQDKNLQELIDAVKSVEGHITDIVRKAEIEREEKLSRNIIKSLENAFKEVMSDLSGEYSWFGIEGKTIPEGSKKKMVAISSGPLDHITVIPNVTQMAPGEKKKFIVKAWTKKKKLIPLGVTYSWNYNPFNLGLIETQNNECIFTASKEGDVTISVTASLDDKKCKAEISVIIMKESEKKSSKGSEESRRRFRGGFPTLRSVYMPAEDWRSRWNDPLKTLEFNSGHKDYKSAKKKGQKALFRYLGFLLAKQLVLHNFKDSGEDHILERMIEVVTNLNL